MVDVLWVFMKVNIPWISMDPMGDVKGPRQIIQNSGGVLGVGMMKALQ